jgi:hypothetical protein
MTIIDELGEFDVPRAQLSGEPHVGEEGVRRINLALEKKGHPHLPPGFPFLIESRMGKIAQRVGRFMRTFHDIKLRPKELEHIGNIVDQFIIHGKVIVYDFTYDVLTWESGSFGNRNGSCWRNSYAASIPMFQIGTGAGPGFALRLFEAQLGGPWHRNSFVGYGRCWIMPVSDTVMLAFNAYGEKLPVLVDVLMNVLPEKQYKHKTLMVRNDAEGIYLNNGSATMIYDKGHDYPEDDELVLNMPRHYTRQCQSCGRRWGSRRNRGRLCSDCGVTCLVSGETISQADAVTLSNVNIEYGGKSIFVAEGPVERSIALKSTYFCERCLAWHGNKDICP